MKAKITRTLVEKAAIPVDANQSFVRDSIIQGFALRVSDKGTKSFVVEKRVKGRPGKSRNVRKTIGKYPQVSVEDARREALKLLSDMTFGIDVNKQVKLTQNQKIQESITVIQVLDDYICDRKNLKERTKSDYKLALIEAMPEWLDKPMCELTKEDVSFIHSRRGKKSKARADNAMRVIRALFNYASEKYADKKGESLFTVNPVSRLSNTKAWYNVQRKQTLIKSHELPTWFNAVYRLKDDNPNSNGAVVSDLLLFILFNGLRRTEALTIETRFIDLYDKSFRLPETKNSRAHTLPLTDFTMEIVRRRLSETRNQYLFPSIMHTGHLSDPGRQMEKVKAWSGTDFTLHDLRRTFATIAESLDIPYYALKLLLNHKTNTDVTAGYVISDVNRLREPMKQVEKYLLDKGAFLWG